MRFIKPLSFAVLSALGMSSVYADSLSVYGKVNVSGQMSDEGEGSYTELKSNASRFGVKGDYKLTENLEAVYLLEWQVDVADASGSDNLKSRNQYVGLKGDFGTVLVGRRDTVLKDLSKPADMFNDYEGDLKALWKGENRMSNSVTYISPTFSGFTGSVTYIAEDEVEGSDGVSAALSFGDKKLKKSNLYAAVAIDSEVKGYDAQRAIVHAKFDDWTVGGILHNQEAVVDGKSENGFTLSTSYSFNDWKFKAQHQTLEDDSSTSIGADYKLAKNTKAYVWYTDAALENSEDKNWLGVGLEHKF
ncbi:porin [Alteromonas sp. ASW11-130]|uniref:porin n=1 Tax=Alteromonas sp. ASW11-130 TaxID=3015775 RepID=UPI002241B533|nr:porin [Alteromonas sp. ASW11-130]MCW8090385.1 porin [Alteromonas sp. ASW11-130]